MATISSRERWVAARKRTFTRRVRSPPTRRISFSCSTRRKRDWSRGDRSATSSRNRVPPSVFSMAPFRSRSAPVKAPLVWPKSSVSSKVSAYSEQLMGRKGPFRPEWSWSSRAVSSLPEPVGPRIRTGSSDGATRTSSVITVAMGSEPSVSRCFRDAIFVGGAAGTSRASHGAISWTSGWTSMGVPGSTAMRTAPTRWASQRSACPHHRIPSEWVGSRNPCSCSLDNSPGGGWGPAPRVFGRSRLPQASQVGRGRRWSQSSTMRSGSAGGTGVAPGFSAVSRAWKGAEAVRSTSLCSSSIRAPVLWSGCRSSQRKAASTRRGTRGQPSQALQKPGPSAAPPGAGCSARSILQVGSRSSIRAGSPRAAWRVSRQESGSSSCRHSCRPSWRSRRRAPWAYRYQAPGRSGCCRVSRRALARAASQSPRAAATSASSSSWRGDSRGPRRDRQASARGRSPQAKAT